MWMEQELTNTKAMVGTEVLWGVRDWDIFRRGCVMLWIKEGHALETAQRWDIKRGNVFQEENPDSPFL